MLVEQSNYTNSNKKDQFRGFGECPHHNSAISTLDYVFFNVYRFQIAILGCKWWFHSLPCVLNWIKTGIKKQYCTFNIFLLPCFGYADPCQPCSGRWLWNKNRHALPFYQSKVSVCPVASKKYVLSIKLQVKSVVNETFHPIFIASEKKSQTALIPKYPWANPS